MPTGENWDVHVFSDSILGLLVLCNIILYLIRSKKSYLPQIKSKFTGHKEIGRIWQRLGYVRKKWIHRNTPGKIARKKLDTFDKQYCNQIIHTTPKDTSNLKNIAFADLVDFNNIVTILDLLFIIHLLLIFFYINVFISCPFRTSKH